MTPVLGVLQLLLNQSDFTLQSYSEVLINTPEGKIICKVLFDTSEKGKERHGVSTANMRGCHPTTLQNPYTEEHTKYGIPAL